MGKEILKTDLTFKESPCNLITTPMTAGIYS